MQLETDVRLYINNIVGNLPASEGRLVQIMATQDTDDICKILKNMVQTGWPNRKALKPELQEYWQYRQDLLVADGLLMKGKRLVIPVTMQEEMLNKIHEGHQSMTKCIARAQQSVCWPCLTKHIKHKVEN